MVITSLTLHVVPLLSSLCAGVYAVTQIMNFELNQENNLIVIK